LEAIYFQSKDDQGLAAKLMKLEHLLSMIFISKKSFIPEFSEAYFPLRRVLKYRM
jgi:hypothetical protein